MSLFGNIGLACMALCLLALFNMAVLRKSPGGDAGVGHAFAVFILCGGLLVSAAVTTLAVGWRGGFDRFGGSTSARALVGVAWFALTAIGFYLLGDPATFLPKAVRVVGIHLLSVLVLAWAALHLNDGLARAVPAGAASALTLGIVALCILPLLGQVVRALMR